LPWIHPEISAFQQESGTPAETDILELQHIRGLNLRPQSLDCAP
jgi:hypothetical protein